MTPQSVPSPIKSEVKCDVVTVQTRVVLHIGTHKTGTTSFQRWFRDNEPTITSTCGATMYKGRLPDARELGALLINPDRETPDIRRRIDRGENADAGAPPLRGTPEWDQLRTDVFDNVQQQLAAATSTFVVSSESLSLLRHPSEISRLTQIFPPEHTTVVVCLRTPEDFLSSWKRHLDRDFFEFSKDPTSFAYVQPDSWLVDYEQLLRAYRDGFGQDSVVVVDYDSAISEYESTIPPIARTFCSDLSALPAWDSYILNTKENSPRKPIPGIAKPHHYRRYYLWVVGQWRRNFAHAFRKHVLRRGVAA